MNKFLTQARLQEALSYNPSTGVFVWRNPRSRVKPGSVAGWADGAGYLGTAIDGKHYRNHRLAWLYVYGTYPSSQIDHMDGNRSNNSICNLRLASQSENNQNQRVGRGTNRDGILGVYLRKDTNRWTAKIGLNGRSRTLGCFDTAEAAKQAYLAAKKELHPFQMIAA